MVHGLETLERLNEEACRGQKLLPMYKSHKVVYALKIAAIDLDLPTGAAVITPADPGYGPFPVDAEYMGKHKPRIGGYYVVYEDGYKSWSPSDAFEKGYTKVEAVKVAIHELRDDSGDVVHACATASFPLPPDHWIYSEPGQPESIDCTEEALRELRVKVREALKYTIQVCTMRGKDMDFDPDAMCMTLDHTLFNPVPAPKHAAIPTLAEWMEGWEAEVESGQSRISREEAQRRYYEKYGRGE